MYICSNKKLKLNMKTLITKEDITKLVGKFIVQLDNNQEHTDITKGNDGFWLEKRISFVGVLYRPDGQPHVPLAKGEQLIILNGLYYTHGIFTPEEFVEYFNYGYKSKKERFHRLLTAKELDWLNYHLKEEK